MRSCGCFKDDHIASPITMTQFTLVEIALNPNPQTPLIRNLCMAVAGPGALVKG